MKLTVETVKAAFDRQGYVWENINVVAIRTSLQVPDIFNDVLCVAWQQPPMPKGLSAVQQQAWLNDNFYTGKDGSPLKVDGQFGGNSNFALQQLQATVGTHRMRTYLVTTDPGSYWLLHPLNTLGTAVLKPGQYKNSHSIGFHQGKSDHRALVQTGKVTVYRDKDKDDVAEATRTEDTGLFGINVHGASKGMVSKLIGKWSAGCIVHPDRGTKDEMLKICGWFKTARDNKFTLTLLREEDL